MTSYVIDWYNPIYRADTPWNHGLILGSGDMLQVMSAGEIYVSGLNASAVYGLGNDMYLSINGVLWSDGGPTINIRGNNNNVFIGPQAHIQGHYNDPYGTPWAGIQATGATTVTNYGFVNSPIAVNFFDRYEYAPYATKTLENYGYINGSVASFKGGDGIDIVINHIGATLSGSIDLGLGNDVFWLGGQSAPVHLGPGNDRVEVLPGASIAHALFGGDGNDTLKGGAGDDTFYGEAGMDTFVFDSAMGNTYDLIYDFVSGQDKIQLNRDKFANLAPGANQTLASDSSQLNGAGLIYKNGYSYGILSYDADGAGGVAPFTIALLRFSPQLLANDIIVI